MRSRALVETLAFHRGKGIFSVRVILRKGKDEVNKGEFIPLTVEKSKIPYEWMSYPMQNLRSMTKSTV